MTDSNQQGAPSLGMVVPETPNIVSAERLSDGIVITFDNGQCGFYASWFLFSKLPECEELNEEDVDW